MNKSRQAKVLFRALTDVSDSYVKEARETAASDAAAEHTGFFTSRNVMRFTIALAACLVIFFAGRSILNPSTPSGSGTGDMTQDVNPLQEVSSMEEAEKITGFALKAPESVGASTGRIITVYSGNMIEVSYENGNDSGCSIRKAAGSDDISGDSNEYAALKTVSINNSQVTLKGENEKWSVATWTADGYSYAVDTQTDPMALPDLAKLISAIK